MDHRDAVALIKDAVSGHEGVWADLGAGSGVFTRALVELLSAKSCIYALDRDVRALSELSLWAGEVAANVRTVDGDFRHGLSLPGHAGPLDGILLANSLHFVRDQTAVLGGLVRHLRPGGRLILLEYDRRAANRWVPYPIPLDELPTLAAAAGLSVPRVTAMRTSEYSGILYAAAMDRTKVE
jgi:ubiquinone/menaquinone biosynthesis C-methylase UbiE